MSVPIWFKDPSILLQKDYILEVWPSKNMEDYNQKANAIVRLVLLLTLIGTLVSKNPKFLFIGLITLGIIFIIYKEKQRPELYEGMAVKLKPKDTQLKPSPVEKIVDPSTLNTLLKDNYQEGTKKNPFGNVLLPEIKYNAQRNPAPPSFSPDISENITENTMKNVQQLNPGIKNTNKQLFGSLTDKFYLDQSNRLFNSTPNTRIPNDQGAFAEYLYGDMPSCKDGDGIQCIKDNYRYTLY